MSHEEEERASLARRRNLCMCTYVYTHVRGTYVCVYIYICVPGTYVCVYMYTYMYGLCRAGWPCLKQEPTYVYMGVHMYTYVYLCIHMGVYMYMYE
jgi:hypothetical protein